MPTGLEGNTPELGGAVRNQRRTPLPEGQRGSREIRGVGFCDEEMGRNGLEAKRTHVFSSGCEVNGERGGRSASDGVITFLVVSRDPQVSLGVPLPPPNIKGAED